MRRRVGRGLRGLRLHEPPTPLPPAGQPRKCQGRFGLRQIPGNSNGWIINGLDVAPAGTLPAAALQEPSGGGITENIATTALTTGDLAPFVTAALARWTAAGLDPVQIARLEAAQFGIRDLDGEGALGLAGSRQILLDDNAAGYGWYVDPTPADDSEFSSTVAATELRAASGPAAGRIDLLTVVMHELGHLIALDDLDPAYAPHDLMTGTLGTGTRRLPASGSAAATTDGLGRPSYVAAALVVAAESGSSPTAPSLPVLTDNTASSGPATNGTEATLSSLLAATNGRSSASAANNDSSADTLTGSSGMDLFIFDATKDLATDLKDEMFINDLDFILGS